MTNQTSETVECDIVASNKKTVRVPKTLLVGRVIGKYMDKNIYDQITDNHGVVRYYAGVTKYVEGCKPGGIVTSPGIIYELRF